MSFTRELVRGARDISFDDLPDDVRLAGRTCLLDWLGCALAGAREELTDILVAESATHGPASLIGRDETTSVHWAALINGAASHALDYDDTHMHLSGHPSVPVAPAVLALAEERKAHGRDVLAAFVAGVETECRLGAAMGLGHYGAGWHATATMGAFGAAAGCCHLLGLDEDRWEHAFGIAGIQGSGLKSVFGTMSKPFQAGKAAANGLLAARLASRGFTSSTEIVETHQGYAATHTSTFAPDVLASFQGRWLVTETLFKYHASCYLTHSAIEAALALVDRHKFEPDAVRRIEVVVPPGHLSVCNITEPHTGLEAKFSLRATVAMAILGDDTADPDAFTDARARATDLTALRDRVTVTPSEDIRGTAATVIVSLATAEMLTETTDVGRPADDLERQWERLAQKFARLAVPVAGEDTAWRLHDLLARLETLDDVGELLAMCRTDP